MTRADFLHEGATVFISGESYVICKFVPELSAWALWANGRHVMTVEAEWLASIMDGIKFAEATAA